MRPTLLAALAAALALAGCTPKTPEGAACNDVGGTAQCPEGQRCGADGTCSVAAMACGPTICTASSCDGASNQLSRCDQSGVCATVTTIQCNAHQSCNEDAGRCDCIESVECTAQGTSCVSATKLRTCDIEGVCPFFVGDEDCKLGENCVGTSPAAQCKCPDQGEGPDQGCSEHGLEKCDGLTMYTCAPRVVGSSCLTWQLVKACSNGLVCRPGQAGACVCPDHLEQPPVLLVDPDAAPFDGAEPNGTSPIACRYRTLQAALLDAKAGETVKATASAFPATFPGPAATVPAEVRLVGDESSTVDATRVVFLVEGTGTAGLTVEAGGSVSGLTVRKGTGAATAVGIEVKGASPTSRPSLQDVLVDAQGAGGAFDTGVSVVDVGPVGLNKVSVIGATSAGVTIHMLDGAQAVSAGSLIVDGAAAAAGAGAGVLLKAGDLSLSSPTVKRSASHGLIADSNFGGEVGVSIDGGQIHANRGTGLFIRGAKKLNLVGLRVCENLGSQQSVGGSLRFVGGAYLAGGAPPQADQAFRGLRVHKNSGDQMAFGAGAAAWILDGPSEPFCGPDRNEFAEYVTGLGIAAGAPVFARNNGWKSDPPSAQDAAPFGAQGTMTTGAEPGSSAFCPVASDLACPAP